MGDVNARVLVHFHAQDRASVSLTSTAVGEEAKFVEILLFACFALRHIANLERSQGPDLVADLLTTVDDDAMQQMASDEADIFGDVQLVSHTAQSGGKSFEATLRFSDGSLDFRLKPRGFGLMARGVGFYSPHSVGLLVMYLAKRRKHDAAFLNGLGRAASMCGRRHQTGGLTLANHVELALRIASETTSTWSMTKKGASTPSMNEEEATAITRIRLYRGDRYWMMDYEGSAGELLATRPSTFPTKANGYAVLGAVEGAVPDVEVYLDSREPESSIGRGF